ncbi:MAG: hypothetical protein LEGION0403_FIIPPAGN_02687 [Legionella sp.]|uniref:hypothetical protein n=1 Tax=Legionella sp. TaxID=459 RepID=UPI003D0C5727
MNQEDIIIWQYENIKDLYLASFQRLVTITTLINSGGILLNVTLLSSESTKLFTYIVKICSYSFYPFKWGLISFVIALALNFYILFYDFRYLSTEMKRTYCDLQTKGACSPNPNFENADKRLWLIGRISILFMALGIILSLYPVLSLKNTS